MSANYRREEIAKLFKAKESFLVSYKNTELFRKYNKIPFSARNAPPHYYAEAKHLERARVENLLKKKIAQRPEKKTLIEVIITCNRVTDPKHNFLIVTPLPSIIFSKNQMCHH